MCPLWSFRSFAGVDFHPGAAEPSRAGSVLLSVPLDLLTPPELLKGRRPVCHLRSGGSASEILLWKMS